MTARQAITAACVAMALITLLDRADGRLGFLFSLGFVLVVITVAMSVDIDSLFPAGVLPPALLIGTMAIVSMFWPDAIQVDGLSAHAGFIGRLIAGVIDRGATLIIGHGLALGIIAVRILTAPDR
ncbi:MAG: hypothetical protein JWR83_2887 [Aeromicrobium sp.]|nr:hypothetical protein [Aeromicrobium sp.]